MKELVGNIDIYLLDQILKGRYEQCQRILDAGCGAGRNLFYFLKQGKEVYGVDAKAEAITNLKTWCQAQFSNYPLERFQVQTIEEMQYEEAFFDVIISNAVLHFAQNKAQFEQQLQAMWRVLKPKGHLFVRLASSIGLEDNIIAVGAGRFLLPDESIRFLVTEADLLHYTQQLGGILTEYIKTTNVQGLRAMTTWCLQKH